jgi:hypothetical protein
MPKGMRRQSGRHSEPPPVMTMLDGMKNLIIGGVLLVHGLGHGGALGALLWIRFMPGSQTGGWLAARSWAFPSLATPDASMVASAFWILALIGFAAAALSFWGILLPDEVWRPVAAVSAVVSLVGMILFVGTWPAFNYVAALGVNIAVLVAVLLLHWGPDPIAAT